jgi:hypothetical protein
LVVGGWLKDGDEKMFLGKIGYTVNSEFRDDPRFGTFGAPRIRALALGSYTAW